MNPVDRLHALDAVRAYALLLGVVLHGAASFVEGFPIPMWFDTPSTGAAVIYYVIHMFRMSAFFLIAGFFARMVVERRGVKPFVKDRLKRIAAPLFLGWPLVIIFLAGGAVLGALVHGVENLQSLAALNQPPADAPAGGGGGGGINTAHLWFLYYLLIFYFLFLILRTVVHAIDTGGRLRAATDRIVAFTMSGLWAPVIIALPLIAFHIPFANWSEWLGLPAPFTLMPQLNAIVGYGVPFALGWLLHRQIPLLLELRRWWIAYLAAAVVLTALSLQIIGTTAVWGPAGLEGTQRVIYTFAYMIGLWCWVLGLIGAALRFLSHESAVNRYLADASYFIYLMHMGTLIFFINAMRPFDWHWSIKLTVMIVGSMPILLVMYHYLVRFTWVGAVLNGRRHRKPPQQDTDAAATAT